VYCGNCGDEYIGGSNLRGGSLIVEYHLLIFILQGESYLSMTIECFVSRILPQVSLLSIQGSISFLRSYLNFIFAPFCFVYFRFLTVKFCIARVDM
jgi:hypothetical protein